MQGVGGVVDSREAIFKTLDEGGGAECFIEDSHEAIFRSVDYA